MEEDKGLKENHEKKVFCSCVNNQSNRFKVEESLHENSNNNKNKGSDENDIEFYCEKKGKKLKVQPIDEVKLNFELLYKISKTQTYLVKLKKSVLKFLSRDWKGK